MARYVNTENARLYVSDFVCEQMKNIPTADVVEVKHGKWTYSRAEWGSNDYSKDVYYKCSICGKEYEEFDIDEANYCPHCGAKMEGVKEE